MISQRQLLVGLAILLVPAQHRRNGRFPQLLGHLPGRGKRLLVVRPHRELQELLEVGNEQRAEAVRAGEELLHDLEGGEAHLGVLLVEPGQQQVVRVAQVLLRRPEGTVRRAITAAVPRAALSATAISEVKGGGPSSSPAYFLQLLQPARLQLRLPRRGQLLHQLGQPQVHLCTGAAGLPPSLLPRLGAADVITARCARVTSRCLQGREGVLKGAEPGYFVCVQPEGCSTVWKRNEP